MKLTGKVALITNVSHFMGPAITEEFCREDFQITHRQVILILTYIQIVHEL